MRVDAADELHKLRRPLVFSRGLPPARARPLRRGAEDAQRRQGPASAEVAADARGEPRFRRGVIAVEKERVGPEVLNPPLLCFN